MPQITLYSTQKGGGILEVKASVWTLPNFSTNNKIYTELNICTCCQLVRPRRPSVAVVSVSPAINAVTWKASLGFRTAVTALSMNDLAPNGE